MKADVAVNTIEMDKMSVDKNTDKSTENLKVRKKLLHIASKFSQQTSINGVLFIKSSHNPTMKLIWTIVFLSLLGALIFHCYGTFMDYFSYKTKTSVDQILQDKIQIPFVTICNKNPIRLSKLNETSKEITDFVQRYSFKDFTSLSQIYNDNRPSDIEHLNLLDYLEELRSVNSDNNTYQQRNTSALSNFSNAWEEFYYLLDRLQIEQRKAAGHQIQNMLLLCQFQGTICNASNFVVFPTYDYGNCFTLNTTDFLQDVEGAREGLELWLYLEPDDYITDIYWEKGFQIVLHDPLSYSFPPDDGFQVEPGTLSVVSLQKFQQIHLQAPYGDCYDDVNNEYLKRYKYTYDYYFCMEVCLHKHIATKCKCKSTRYVHIVGQETHTRNLSLCADTTDTFLCSQDASNDVLNCNCTRSCSENKYLKEMSSSQWPALTLANLIADYLCTRKNVSLQTCERLKQMSERDLRENFVAVEISYNTLYVDIFTDQPDVTLTEFLGNLGGCIGLWIGLSIMSLFEIVQFFVQIFSALWNRNTRKLEIAAEK